MAGADMKLVMADYHNGMTVKELKVKYKLNETDLKTLNENIRKELGIEDKELPLSGSTELTLDDETKVLAAKIRTVNQPKGGFVNVYMSQDGKQYYQYTDANGNQQKVTKDWDYISATGDNIEVAWNLLKDGHPWDSLMTLMSGAEDPRGLTTGYAPVVGIAKGGSIIKSMKDFGKWLKQLKNIKSFEQFKSFAMSLIKPTPQMTLQTKTETLSNGLEWQTKFFKTNKVLTTVEGKTIPVGAEIKAHGATLTGSRVENGELLLDVFVDGKAEIIVLKNGGFHSQTWTSKSLNHYLGENYEALLPKIIEFINRAH